MNLALPHWLIVTLAIIGALDVLFFLYFALLLARDWQAERRLDRLMRKTRSPFFP